MEKGVIILAAEAARCREEGEPARDTPVDIQAESHPDPTNPAAATLAHHLRARAVETAAGPPSAPGAWVRRASLAEASAATPDDTPDPSRWATIPQPCAPGAAEFIPLLRTPASGDALQAISEA